MRTFIFVTLVAFALAQTNGNGGISTSPTSPTSPTTPPGTGTLPGGSAAAAMPMVAGGLQIVSMDIPAALTAIENDFASKTVATMVGEINAISQAMVDDLGQAAKLEAKVKVLADQVKKMITELTANQDAMIKIEQALMKAASDPAVVAAIMAMFQEIALAGQSAQGLQQVLMSSFQGLMMAIPAATNPQTNIPMQQMLTQFSLVGQAVSKMYMPGARRLQREAAVRSLLENGSALMKTLRTRRLQMGLPNAAVINAQIDLFLAKAKAAGVYSSAALAVVSIHTWTQDSATQTMFTQAFTGAKAFLSSAPWKTLSAAAKAAINKAAAVPAVQQAIKDIQAAAGPSSSVAMQGMSAVSAFAPSTTKAVAASTFGDVARAAGGGGGMGVGAIVGIVLGAMVAVSLIAGIVVLVMRRTGSAPAASGNAQPPVVVAQPVNANIPVATAV